MDLSTLALKDTFTLALKHPVTDEVLADGDKVVSIELFGTASKQYRNAVTSMQNRALRRQARKEKPNVEQIRDESLNLLVACTAGTANLAIDGKAVVDEEGYRKMYADPRFSWIRDQVDEALGDTSNFLEA